MNSGLKLQLSKHMIKVFACFLEGPYHIRESCSEPCWHALVQQQCLRPGLAGRHCGTSCSLRSLPGTKTPTECLYFMETKAIVNARNLFRGMDLQAQSDQLFASFMGL